MDFTKLTIPKHIKKEIDSTLGDQIICCRFPPAPSGYLHLGHIFAGRLNQSIANVYGGKFLIRFDNTNPETDSDEYANAIFEDLKDMGFDMSHISYTSDYFDLLIDKATELIKNNFAYVESSTQEEICQQRKNFSPSKDRDLSVEQNLERWQQMLNGVNNTLCLRLKAIYNSKNGAMRDPVLYRYLNCEHHRTGNKFKIYPSYDFACPILDSYEKVTHVFRSNEYCERDEQMKFILTKLNMRIPHCITYGRLNVEGSELSKRKIKNGIENGTYTGWDDKKLFTYRGMRKRGISLEGINKFLDDVRFPESTIKIQQQKIFTINTKVIDKNAVRLIAIYKDDLYEMKLKNDGAVMQKSIPLFVGNKNLGERILTLSTYNNCNNIIIVSKKEYLEFISREEITIIHFGNVIYQEPNIFIPNFAGDPNKTSKKILWLHPDNIINAFIELLNNTIIEILVDKFISNIADGAYVHLNKIGYYYKKTDINRNIILVQIES